MNDDQAEAKIDKTKGSLKKGAGELLGDQELKNEGREDKSEGKMKQAWGDVKETAHDAKEAVKDKL